MRELNFSIMLYLLQASKEGDPLHFIVSTHKEAEWTLLKMFREPFLLLCFLLLNFEARVHIELVVHFSLMG